MVIDTFFPLPCVSHIAVELHNGHGRENKAISHCTEAMSGGRPGGTQLLDPAVQRR